MMIENKKKLRAALKDPVLFAKVFFKWEAHPAQRQILQDQHKNLTIAAGRRFGKSEMMAVSALHYAITEPNTIQFIIAPTYDQAKIIFDTCMRFLSHSIWVHLIKKVTYTPFPRLSLHTGSVIHARSADKPENLRGHKAHRIILDEAGFIKDDAVSNVIEPMLADYNGSLIKIGTPNGRNHFYDSFTRSDELYSSYQFPSWSNPHISQEFIEQKKKEYGESSIKFRTEYAAEFIDDQNTVFQWRAVQQCVQDVEQREHGVSGRSYVVGCDIAKYQDYTVIVVLDATEEPLQLVYFERFNKMPYSYVVERIRDLYQRFNHAKVVVDSTGVGDPLLEQLQNIGAEGYVFTQRSKMQLIERLAAALDNQQVVYPGIPELIDELKFFEYVRTGSNYKLEARQGFHDDCVIALALAVYGAGAVKPVEGLADLLVSGGRKH
jgi:phage terminase large subunit-like protein